MKNHSITVDRVNHLLSYNPISGMFTWKVKQGLARVGAEVGTVQNGYRKITIDREQIRCSRLAWFITNGKWPSGQIDHIDGNKLNNAINNLRDVSMSVNMQNRYARKRKDTDLPQGVSKTKHGKFSANIRIGIFTTKEEAAHAYITAKRLIHEGCAR